MPRLLKRRQAQHLADDEDIVIDLTDRLAPYHGAAIRPSKSVVSPLPVVDEPLLWIPLNLDFLAQPSHEPIE